MSVLEKKTESSEKIVCQKENGGVKKNEVLKKNEEADLEVNARFLEIQKSVHEAIQKNKTFMIYGKSRVVRESLLKRGWCEKFYRKNVYPHLNVDSSPEQLLAGIDLLDRQNEKFLISRMLSNHVVDFLWNTGMEYPGWPNQENKTTLFNRYCRAGFTSKIGLCAIVRQCMWYYEPGLSTVSFPRCYNIGQNDQLHAFIDDFRITACSSLLKWLVAKYEQDGEESMISRTGTIPLKVVEFALKRCSDYIDSQSHEDIDQEPDRVWNYSWEKFLEWYYKLVQEQGIFSRNNIPFHKYILAATNIIQKMKKIMPQLQMDGCMNIWIVKPGNKSRGRGIFAMNNLQDILMKINPVNKTEARHVVQKYIEKPFLIYNTKFDIRQWFLLTRTMPLTIWCFKESYLRFSSQNFVLSDFHESIHLCNYSIQCKYNNCNDRDPRLPADNMWDATTFRVFLKEQGHGNIFDEIIYPAMKEALIGVLLASQEGLDRRAHSFELYGADFMVMEDFSVWLIEINSHPDMSNSTSVTSRLCPQVLEDTIKVVIDHRDNKDADTGQFELIYKQKIPTCLPCVGAALSLQGTRVQICEKKSSQNLPEKCIQNSKSSIRTVQAKKIPVKNHIGPIIVDLLEKLEMQLDEDFGAYFKKNSVKIKNNTYEMNAKSEKKNFVSVKTETEGPENRISEVEPSREKKVNSSSTNRKKITKKEKNETPKTSKNLATEINFRTKNVGFETIQKNGRNKKGTQNLSLLALPSTSKTAAERKRMKNSQKNRIVTKKNKILLDVTDMHANGLSLEKK